MRSGKHWMFQAPQSHAEVAQQDIAELTDLVSGLLAFERAYLTTHGEKTPVFRLLSMVNAAIRRNIDIIEDELVNGTLKRRESKQAVDDIPF